ncbi:MAG: MerR family transcriptional regulator [Rhodocyclales bacterium]|nr:MerR family transcriptional regulator [Rhodocyclales bacterium]
MVEERFLPIGLVARETGMSRDVLRKWEDRYGFPSPIRNPAGTRLYPESQVERLRAIKRLIDAGRRPAEVVMPERRASLAGGSAGARSDAFQSRIVSTIVADAMDTLKTHDVQRLHRILERDLLSNGLRRFILSTAVPLIRAVGNEWKDGGLPVYKEHVFSRVLESILDNASRRLALPGGSPRMLLTTVPGELHTLGICMARSLFLEAGADCLYLGAQMPLADIVAAVDRYRIEVLGLSFSDAFPTRQIRPCLEELRERIAPDVDIWVGGTGAVRLPRIPFAVSVFADIGDAAAELHTLRARRG